MLIQEYKSIKTVALKRLKILLIKSVLNDKLRRVHNFIQEEEKHFVIILAPFASKRFSDLLKNIPL